MYATFPCNFSGVLTLTLSWTLLDIPLDMARVPSLTDLHGQLEGQMMQLCTEHQSKHALSARACVGEISEEIDLKLAFHCNNDDDDDDVDYDGDNYGDQTIAQLSLAAFREDVADVLRLPSTSWTVDDLDKVPGWVHGSSADPLDHCGHIWRQQQHEHHHPHGHHEHHQQAGSSTSTSSPPATVLVVGEYLAIDRDFLLRDLLGCVQRIRYCVEDEADYDEAAVRELLAYEAFRRPHALAAMNMSTDASVGRCDPPPPPLPVVAGGVIHGSSASTVATNRTVLVFNLNRWGSPSAPHEPDPVRSVILPLLARWRPAILVHLSEEVPREDPGELRSVYEQASLVLRPYYHHHEPAFRTMLQQQKSGSLGGNVVIVPIGYGAGVVDEGLDGRPRSGVSAALEWVLRTGESSSEQRELRWAFAGRLGVHPSRGAMSSVFSGAGGAWGRSYERHVHTGTAFAGAGNGGAGPLTPQEVGRLYRRAAFVPSPPGNSPDCFRHFEALVNGALPVLDGRPTDYAWWPHFLGYHRHEAGRRTRGGSGGDASFPAPLGLIFAEMHHPNGSRAETDLERAERDALGFDREAYTLLRKRPPRHPQDAAASNHERCSVSGASDTEEEEGEEPAWMVHEQRWRLALKRARAMGDEEVDLRRALNARWYVSAISAVRARVQWALTLA